MNLYEKDNFIADDEGDDEDVSLMQKRQYSFRKNYNQPMRQSDELVPIVGNRLEFDIKKTALQLVFAGENAECDRHQTIGVTNSEEDARRLAICWNVCQGNETEWLESVRAASKTPVLTYFINQNSELHEALAETRNKLDRERVKVAASRHLADRLNEQIMAGQSKKASAAEAMLNVAVGAGVALLAQIIFYPLFNIHIPLSTDFALMGIFTVISLVRSYALRRLFNFWGRK